MRQQMGIQALFHPKSVAVVGASSDPSRIGGRVVHYLKEHYSGRILPINPARDVVQGISAFPSIRSLDAPPDLAIVAVAATAVVDTVAELADFGTSAAIIYTSGFAETGEDGRRAQLALAAVARETGIRLIGPNCVGAISLPEGMFATFATPRRQGIRQSGLAVVSQSGALGVTFWNSAQDIGVGSSYLATTGNEADVSAAEVVEFLIEQPDVSAIMLFVEGIKEPDRFLDVGLRALELGKPIVALKAGTSEEGAKAAISHTASLAVSDRLVGALFKRAGILRVDNPTELVSVAAACVSGRFPAGNRVGVMTVSGATGVLVADEASKSGLVLPRPSEDKEEIIRRRIPSFGSTRNPIDYTANVVNDPESFEEVLDAVCGDDNFDALIVAGTSASHAKSMADAIAAKFRTTDKPILVYSADQGVVHDLLAAEIPAFGDPMLAARAAGLLNQYTTFRSGDILSRPAVPKPRTVPSEPGRTLSSSETQTMLRRSQIPFVAEISVFSPDGAASAAAELGFPVAVKLDPQSAAHKSEIGGVRLWLKSEEEVRAAAVELMAIFAQGETSALVVQKMLAADIELMIGGVRDEHLGPIAVLGIGGRLVEILDQTVIGLIPLSKGEASRMAGELCGGRLLNNARGLSEAALSDVVDILDKVSELLASHEEILEIDLNPVVTHERGAVAVDALIRVAGKAR